VAQKLLILPPISGTIGHTAIRILNFKLAVDGCGVRRGCGVAGMSVGSGIGTVLSAIVLHDDASGHTFLPNVTVVHEGEEVPEMLQQSAVLCVDFSTEGDVKSIA